jgi:hypothetical protein
MWIKIRSACLALPLLAGCGHPGQGHRQSAPESDQAQPTVPPPVTGPNARTPLAPAKPPADPKSTAAAEQLARGFAQLLNEGKLDEAYMLLGPNAAPRADFDRQLTGIKDLQATVGTPGQQDGAAGSIYIGIPLTISGELSGKHVSWPAGLILRRVNDVPGSTEAQRRWHIERLNLSGSD